jgi:hypothetical protein
VPGFLKKYFSKKYVTRSACATFCDSTVIDMPDNGKRREGEK